jgi:hypothetical protein
MSDILTDEMVEKAARAAYERQYPGGLWEASCLTDDFRDNARAALTAALPLIVEECRQAIITPPAAMLADYNYSSGWDAAIEHASACLQDRTSSLSPKEKE